MTVAETTLAVYVRDLHAALPGDDPDRVYRVATRMFHAADAVRIHRDLLRAEALRDLARNPDPRD